MKVITYLLPVLKSIKNNFNVEFENCIAETAIQPKQFNCGEF